MNAFEFCVPTEIVFGPGTERRAGTLVQKHGGSRILVVYGGSSAQKSGLLQRVTDALQEAGLEFSLLGGAQPNPRLSFVRAGIQAALEFQADFLLAVGGGSVIDAAKAIADGAANPACDVWDFWLRRQPLARALPVGVVLTISAAGSETSTSAVLTRDDTLEKRGLNADCHRPRFAVMNPELTYTLPPFQLSCGIVDIMMHTLDRYFGDQLSNDLTDEIAEGILRTAMKNGAAARKNQQDYHAMSELMWAGSLSHNGLSGLGAVQDFATHQLGHELSAKFDYAHGATLSAMWGSWASYCAPANPARFARYGVKVLGLDPDGKDDLALAQLAIRQTVAFFRTLDMPTSIPQLPCGVLDEATLQDLAYRCTFYRTRTIGSFKVLDYEDILAIYRMANR